MDYRDAAMQLVEDHIISSHALLIAALKYMSQDDVYDLLVCNELSQYLHHHHSI